MHCETAQSLKHEGIGRVLGNNDAWKIESIKAVESLPKGWTGTGEDIRQIVGSEPAHPNAWGGLVNRALTAELIYPTGDYTAMKSKASHGRRTPVYERL